MSFHNSRCDISTTSFRRYRAAIQLNSSKTYLDEFAQEAAASLSAGALMLDAGAGRGPYRHWFSHVQYESADVCKIEREYGEITYVCDLVDIPVEDDRYNLVLFTQVLEHVPEPKRVLEELYRVIKPGGELWLSAPLYFEEHEAPFDYYRYTRYGFSHLLQSAGFSIRRIEWLEGYFGTLSYQLKLAARVLPIESKHFGGGLVGFLLGIFAFPLKIAFLVLSWLFSKLDIRHKYIDAGHCKNYAIICLKGETSDP